jgi:hypothetical protein
VKLVSIFGILAILVISLFPAACSKPSESKSDCIEGGKVGVVCFKSLNSPALSFSSGTINGTGSALAVGELATETSSGKNISVAFSLSDAGSLTLKTFSKPDLSGGVDIKLSRAGTKLELKFVKGATESSAKELVGIDASSEVKLIVDVHNDEDPAHILVWNGSGTFALETPLLNSEDDDVKPSGQGSDKYWGVTLANAKLTQAVLSEPKKED